LKTVAADVGRVAWKAMSRDGRSGANERPPWHRPSPDSSGGALSRSSVEIPVADIGRGCWPAEVSEINRVMQAIREILSE
jgi:hypothetical protein